MSLGKDKIAYLTGFFGIFILIGSLSYSFPDFLHHSVAASRIAAGEVLYRDHIRYINVYHYPPIYLYTLGALYAITGVDMLIAKGLLAASTVSTAILLYFLCRQLLNENRAWLTTVLFLLSPLTFIGVYGGYFDPFVTVFVLASLVCILANRPLLAGVLLAVGVLSKPFPLLFGPIVAIYYWQTKKTDILRFGGSFTAVAVLISLPFLLLAPEKYIHYAFLYNFQRQAASLSLYYYFLPWLVDTVWTTLLPAGYVIFLSVIYLQKRLDAGQLFLEGVTLLLLGFFVLNRINYPHYLLYVTPFFSATLVKHYCRQSSLLGQEVWKHLLTGFGIALLGAGIWAYPWFIGVSGFRSHELFWIGAGLYFTGVIYQMGVLFAVILYQEDLSKIPERRTMSLLS